MWTCPFQPPVQLYFIIRNTEYSLDFGISRIKIWNYNRSVSVRALLFFLMCHHSLYLDITLKSLPHIF